MDWQVIGLDGPTDDVVAIKRAYALKLRVTRPDDDAVAYQALREAYERLMQQARALKSREAEAQVMAPPAPPVEDVLQPQLPEESSPSPEALCDLFMQACRGPGHALPAALDDIRAQLLELPLSAQHEASLRFADLVIEHHAWLPKPATQLLQSHFEWFNDFRLARQLGPQRAGQLAEALPQQAQPITDPEMLKEFAELRGLQALLDSTMNPLLAPLLRLFIATLLGPLLERQLYGTPLQILHRLGLQDPALREIDLMRQHALWLRRALTSALVGAVGWALGDGADGAWEGLIIGAALGTFLPWLLLMPLRYLAWLRQLDLRPELGWLRAMRRVIGPSQWPWAGIALLGLTAVLLVPALRWLPDQPLPVFGVALGFVLLGLALALPPLLTQALSAIAVLAYTVAAVRPEHAWVLALCLAWVLGVTQLQVSGRIKPPAVRGYAQQNGLARFALVTIGLPAYIAWLSDRVGHRLVIAALLLAWSPHFFAGDPFTSPWSPWPMAVGSLSLLVHLQGRALGYGRRLLQRLTGVEQRT